MPSIENKIQFHLKMIDLVHQLLPICYIYVEIGYFNIQKIQNPEISGKEYQEGQQKGFWNVREYVLFRDNHTCQYCKGKSGDNILRVHHIESRKTGGNSPSNLITLCKTCHDKHHKGEINLRIKRGKSFKDESYMNIMKNTLMERIAKKYKTNEIIFPTFSYQTKYVRSQENLPRNVYSDSFVISGNYLAKQCDIKYICRQIRRHNRQIHRAKFSKDGVRKNTQVSYLTFGFRLHDIVRYNGDLYRIISRRITGGFDIIRLSDGYFRKISYKKLKFVSISNRLVMYSNKF
jgi:N6-L-threonylcarbamoyladenine synthase